MAKTQVWLLLVRGDHDMNEVKSTASCPGLDNGFRFATVPELREPLRHQARLPGAYRL